MSTIMDVDVPKITENVPKYVDSVSRGVDTNQNFRYSAYRTISTEKNVISELYMKFTGTRHLLLTCILFAIRNIYPSATSAYFGTKANDTRV